ncbi:MAG: hypothetical protein WCZ87_13210, partial [Thiohalobacteraceae bacterium]
MALVQGGGNAPTDMFGAEVVRGLWPEDSSIAQLRQLASKYQQEAYRRLERAEDLESAERGVRNAVQSVHADVMYERMAKLVRDQKRVVDNAIEITKGVSAMVTECESLQLSLVSLVEAERPAWDAAIEAGEQQAAAVVLANAKAKAATKAQETITWIAERGAKMAGSLGTVTPASWGTSAEAPATA